MQLHLLLTDDIAQTKPETCKISMNFGQLIIRFDKETIKTGLHCVVEDTQQNIVDWLKPYDSFVKGSGVPQLERFSIAHVK